MQYFYEFYLATCTCRQNIGHYQTLVLFYISQGKSWPEIFELLHIDKICCRNKLAMPYTANFDYQLEQVVDGKIDASELSFEGFNYLTYIHGPIYRNILPPKSTPTGEFIPLSNVGINKHNKTKEPVYVGRPIVTDSSIIRQQKLIGTYNGSELNVQRIATKYICA